MPCFLMWALVVLVSSVFDLETIQAVPLVRLIILLLNYGGRWMRSQTAHNPYPLVDGPHYGSWVGPGFERLIWV
jgi:hypothetical protein